ncbi:hypothetical protein CYY_001798 [Polysphondylium violaceum]|uniref:Uncharacterized protein n=1 Tax=Polysphondylium violaceum TaxID=133409 RepID=A0A8J4Q0G8_9MYCE|nr:hypothetical protein CYY_001798 [Polysphondylium violaceum]
MEQRGSTPTRRKSKESNNSNNSNNNNNNNNNSNNNDQTSTKVVGESVDNLLSELSRCSTSFSNNSSNNSIDSIENKNTVQPSSTNSPLLLSGNSSCNNNENSSNISCSNNNDSNQIDLKFILDDMSKNYNPENNHLLFPRDQFSNFICIYKGCNKPIRSNSIEQYLIHLKIHDLKNDTILDHLLQKSRYSCFTDMNGEEEENLLEEALSFAQESLHKYESLFNYVDQQQQTQQTQQYSQLVPLHQSSHYQNIRSKVSVANEFAIKKRRPDRLINNNNNNNSTSAASARSISSNNFEDDDNTNQEFKNSESRINNNNTNNDNNKDNIPVHKSSPSLPTFRNNDTYQNQYAIPMQYKSQPPQPPKPPSPKRYQKFNQQQHQQIQHQPIQFQFHRVNPSPHGNEMVNYPMIQSPQQHQFVDDQNFATPTKFSSRGIQLRQQMMKYGLKLFRMDSEGKYICFFQGCSLHMITNFSRHVAKHEKVGDRIKPELFHLSNLYTGNKNDSNDNNQNNNNNNNNNQNNNNHNDRQINNDMTPPPPPPPQLLPSQHLSSNNYQPPHHHHQQSHNQHHHRPNSPSNYNNNNNNNYYSPHPTSFRKSSYNYPSSPYYSAPDKNEYNIVVEGDDIYDNVPSSSSSSTTTPPISAQPPSTTPLSTNNSPNFTISPTTTTTTTTTSTSTSSNSSSPRKHSTPPPPSTTTTTTTTTTTKNTPNTTNSNTTDEIKWVFKRKS